MSAKANDELKEHAACAYFAPVKHAPTAIDPSGNTVGMAMCMYLNSGSVVLNASRVSDGSARPFTAQAYSILSFVGVNAYLCDALNDDDADDDDALVMSFPIVEDTVQKSSTTIATDARPIATDAMRSSTNNNEKKKRRRRRSSTPSKKSRFLLLLPPPNNAPFGGIIVVVVIEVAVLS